MSVLVYSFVFAGCALASWWGCKRLIDWLQAAAVLDIPNHRSLHGLPVPRGAGLAIAMVVLLAQCGLALSGVVQWRETLVLLAAGAGFAALGWADDRGSKPVLLRLIAQFVIAGGCVLGLAFPLLNNMISMVVAGVAIAALVWHVNLFNFMDGADGFAAAQAIMVAFGLAILLANHGDVGLALWAVAIAGATAGFLRWNWSPARIFLGDSGSYFLGFELAVLIYAARLAGVGLAAMIILLAPFVVDATLTLLGRMLSGRTWWQAHRSHAYQLLVLRGWSPSRLALTLATSIGLVGWPLSWLAAYSTHSSVIAVFAYALTGIMWGTIRWTAEANPAQP